jgi:ABC-type oligopeptide transport system ATPase subunit
MSGPLLQLHGVSKTYRSGLLSRAPDPAVIDVSFTLPADRPEIFTIIGESGSGKTTLSRIILNLLKPSGGAITFNGRDLNEIRSRKDRLAFMSRVQPIFQNPFEAFNPLKAIDRYLYESAKNFLGSRSQAEREAQADQALRKVGLSLTEVRGRYPHELSGGQLQRVAIARALVPNPALIVADEPVSMIDASLRMTIVNLFKSLRDELRVSIIYITHDLATAYYISDRLIIMQKGQVVESGDARTVLSAPTHPYSIRLREAVLTADGAWDADPAPSPVPAALG